jgi:hypothetical protein
VCIKKVVLCKLYHNVKKLYRDLNVEKTIKMAKVVTFIINNLVFNINNKIILYFILIFLQTTEDINVREC